MLMTSLAEIRSFNPCPSGWKDIVRAHSDPITGEYDSEKQFPLVDCVESNSIADVCWLLGKREVEIQICMRFTRMCADSVAHLNNHYSRRTAAYVAAAYAAVAVAAAAAADDAAAYAAVAAAAAADDVSTYAAQKEKNKQFLIQCINEWEC